MGAGGQYLDVTVQGSMRPGIRKFSWFPHVSVTCMTITSNTWGGWGGGEVVCVLLKPLQRAHAEALHALVETNQEISYGLDSVHFLFFEPGFSGLELPPPPKKAGKMGEKRKEEGKGGGGTAQAA
jgi:hypothetical protein